MPVVREITVEGPGREDIREGVGCPFSLSLHQAPRLSLF